MPATKAKASSTLKWRLAISEQLAIGACCGLWRISRSQRGKEEGRKLWPAAGVIALPWAPLLPDGSL